VREKKKISRKTAIMTVVVGTICLFLSFGLCAFIFQMEIRQFLNSIVEGIKNI